MTLRDATIKLAYDKPHLREHLLPLLKEARGLSSQNTEVRAFLRAIETQFRKTNKHGLFQIEAQPLTFGTKSIFMRFTLLPKEEWPNGLIKNDPAHHQIWMHNSFTDEGLSPVILMERTMGGIIKSEGKRHLIGWRNIKGSPDTILKALDTYFQKMSSLAEDLGYSNL